jgi:hypothetical protein
MSKKLLRLFSCSCEGRVAKMTLLLGSIVLDIRVTKILDRYIFAYNLFSYLRKGKFENWKYMYLFVNNNAFDTRVKFVFDISKYIQACNILIKYRISEYKFWNLGMQRVFKTIFWLYRGGCFLLVE